VLGPNAVLTNGLWRLTKWTRYAAAVGNQCFRAVRVPGSWWNATRTRATRPIGRTAGLRAALGSGRTAPVNASGKSTADLIRMTGARVTAAKVIRWRTGSIAPGDQAARRVFGTTRLGAAIFPLGAAEAGTICVNAAEITAITGGVAAADLTVAGAATTALAVPAARQVARTACISAARGPFGTRGAVSIRRTIGIKRTAAVYTTIRGCQGTAPAIYAANLFGVAAKGWAALVILTALSVWNTADGILRAVVVHATGRAD
jgi:hypothetical protein